MPFVFISVYFVEFRNIEFYKLNYSENVCCTVQSQKAVSAHFTSKQKMPFGCIAE